METCVDVKLAFVSTNSLAIVQFFATGVLQSRDCVCSKKREQHAKVPNNLYNLSVTNPSKDEAQHQRVAIVWFVLARQKRGTKWQIYCEKIDIYSYLHFRLGKGIYVHDAGHDEHDGADGLKSQPQPYDEP